MLSYVPGLRNWQWLPQRETVAKCWLRRKGDVMTEQDAKKKLITLCPRSWNLSYWYITLLVRLLQGLCDPIDGNPPGSAIPGILQARTLEWVATSFSNAWKWKAKVKSLSCVRFLATPWTAAHQAPPSMGFFRQEYWSGLQLPSPITLLAIG